MGYNQLIKQHLADYKIRTLGIRRNGVWKRNNIPYPHILPEERGILNILSAYREDFCDYLDTYGIKLHKDFHHLNSSQAMCFNLFFPFMFEDNLGLLASKVLSLTENEIREAEFEKIIDSTEATNFDFFMELVLGSRIFFELKLSEADFGTARADSKHKKKLDDIYRPRLEGKVVQQYLDEGLFFQHYQILRNISYIGTGSKDILFFIFPRANDRLAGTEEIIMGMVTDCIRDKIRIIYLEDLANGIIRAIGNSNSRMVEHYQEFKAKYISR